MLNDRPVACQIRGPTDPQGDRWHGEAVTDEVSPRSGVKLLRPRPQAAPPIPWRRQPPPAKAALGAALARFDDRPNCPAHQPLPSHYVSGSGARGISSPLNRQCYPPHQFREISTVKFAPAAPRKEVLKRSFKWRFWLLLSPKTKVTRARKREIPPPAPAGAENPPPDPAGDILLLCIVDAQYHNTRHHQRDHGVVLPAELFLQENAAP